MGSGGICSEEERKFSASARIICCLFLSVVVFTMLMSYVGLTRASWGRRPTFQDETMYKKSNFKHVELEVQYRRHRNKTPVYLSSAYSRSNEQQVCCTVMKCINCCFSLSV